MQSLDALNLLPVWVNPEHLASTAKIILAGHKLKVLGVVDGNELVGIITAARAEGEPDRVHIREFMTRPSKVVDSSTSLRELAETFYEEDLDFLPIVEGEQFRGIVTPNMLLRELARSWDPLTNLSWSDSLREWGVKQLKEGAEITIMFIDLDDFGNYNKKYGHIVGDRVLTETVKMLESNLDADKDLLVRYGGDEFVIGSLRSQADAMMLTDRLRKQMADLRIEGSPEPVTFSIGVQGGKRTKERENVHYAATLDNLINLASKTCVAQKERTFGRAVAASPARTPAPETVAATAPAASTTSAVAAAPIEEEVTPETAADLAETSDTQSAVETAAPETAVVEVPEAEAKASAAPVGPAHIADVTADAVDANSVTQVVIEAGGQNFTGICPRKGGSVVKSVALATANAITQMRPDVKLEIREVNLTESETGVRFISVIGTTNIDGESQPIGGVGTVGRNLYMTVAGATLQAYTNLEAIIEGAKE